MSRRLESPLGKDAPALLSATEPCAFCPNLCLHACPVATATGRTTEAPWALMTLSRWLATGDSGVTPDVRRALAACTGCGACTEACLHHVPVAATLQQVRAVLHRSHGPASLAPSPAALAGDRLPAGASGIAQWLAGDMAAFTNTARAVAGALRGRTRVLVDDHADLVCVRDIYPGVRGSSRDSTPTSIERVEATLVLTALDALRASPPVPDGVVGYLPPCTTTARLGPRAERVHGGYAAALESWLGHAPATLRWEETGTCCGAAEPFRSLEPDTARAMGERIVANARDRGIDVLVVLSASCAAHLGAVAEATAPGARPLRVLWPGAETAS